MGVPERVVKRGLRSAEGLDLESDIGLQIAGAAERGYRKKDEEDSDGCGDEDEPGGDVAPPSAEGGIEPDESDDGEECADDFVKKLFDGAPETGEAAWFCGSTRCGHGRGHGRSLAQKAERMPGSEGHESWGNFWRKLAGKPKSGRFRGHRPERKDCGQIGDNSEKVACIQRNVRLEWR